jgi:hypothetical protein
MATTLGPEGRMTKLLTTPYSIGDRVVFLVDEHQPRGCAHVGEVGAIKEVIISDPNDGDETFLMFFVKSRRGMVFLHSDDFAPATEAEAHLWLRHQLARLR